MMTCGYEDPKCEMGLIVGESADPCLPASIFVCSAYGTDGPERTVTHMRESKGDSNFSGALLGKMNKNKKRTFCAWLHK